MKGRPRTGDTVMMRVPATFQRLVKQAARAHRRSAVGQLRVFMEDVYRKQMERRGFVMPERAEYPKL